MKINILIAKILCLFAWFCLASANLLWRGSLNWFLDDLNKAMTAALERQRQENNKK